MYMIVQELNKEQLFELKQNYLCELDDNYRLKEVTGIDRLSQDILRNADDYITDKQVYEYYDGVIFTEDDFFCSCSK